MQSLFEQHSGYLNLYPRIIFALASSVSLEHTPVFVAIAVNSSTALLLLLVYLNWKSVFRSQNLLLLSSLGISLTPILGISSLGNATYFHFQLLAASLLLIASPDAKMHRNTKSIIYVITALSDPLFFLLPMMMIIRLRKKRFNLKSMIAQQTFLLIACAIQGLNMITVSIGNRPLSTNDFNFLESFYLFFDRVIGSTLIPLFGFIDSSSKEDLQKLGMRLAASALTLGVVAYVAKRKAKLLSDSDLYYSLLIASMYFLIGAFTIAPEVRYAIVPAIVLWFVFGYVFDSYLSEKMIVRAAVRTWIVLNVFTSLIPSPTFLEKVEWRKQIEDARLLCKSDKLKEIKITGRPISVARGEVPHGFSLNCTKLMEN
jgi:hypothetical protein